MVQFPRTRTQRYRELAEERPTGVGLIPRVISNGSVNQEHDGVELEAVLLHVCAR